MTKESIDWTRTKLERFKEAYRDSIGRYPDRLEFTFEGHTFVVGYAKYFIEYLEGILPK